MRGVWVVLFPASPNYRFLGGWMGWGEQARGSNSNSVQQPPATVAATVPVAPTGADSVAGQPPNRVIGDGDQEGSAGLIMQLHQINAPVPV